MSEIRDYIETNFSVVNWSGSEAAIHCPHPGHNDATASASINGDTGQFFCHGCNQGGNLTTLAKDLGLSKPPGENGSGQHVTDAESVYRYRGVDGSVLYEVVRYSKNGEKSFYQRKPNGEKGIKGIPQVPYGLPGLVTAFEQGNPVCIVEGEKDAMAIYKTFRMAATTNSGGAGKWKPAHTEYFPEGATVYLCGDADIPGVAHMQEVGKALTAKGCSVLNIDLGFDIRQNHGKDISDWIGEHGPDAAAFQALIDAAEPFEIIEDTSAADSKVVARQFSPMDWTDTGNSEALIRQHGENMLYCHERSSWLAWINERWEMDGQELVQKWAQDTIKRNHADAINIPDREAVLKAVKWALQSLSKYRIACMLDLSRAYLPVKYAELDSYPMLFGVANGYIDLTTGELCRPDKAKLITKFSPLSYDPNATAPRWEKFIEEVFEGNLELIGFVQKAVGYSLSGDTRERAFFLLHGERGNNGKSTFVETILQIVGAYGGSTLPSTLLDTGPKSAGAATPELAALAGLRFLSCGEMEKNNKLDEPLIKRLTGNDTIRARPIYERGFSFVPEFKIFLATNDLPTIRDTGPAMWSRPRVIPFNVRYEGATEDKFLKEKLKTELPGILAWAVRGCLAWQREGLGSPEIVTIATAGYKNAQDPLALFIEETTVPVKDFPTLKAQFYRVYENWCKDNGEKALSQRKLSFELQARGWIETRLTTGLRAWKDVAIREGIEVNYDG